MNPRPRAFAYTLRKLTDLRSGVSLNLFCAAITLCLMGLPAFGTVTEVALQSPQLTKNNAINVTTPVHFQGTAESDKDITGFVVYVDGVNVFQNVKPTLDAWVLLPPGGGVHSVYVTAWDSSGTLLTTSNYQMNITGIAPPMPPPSAVRMLNANQTPNVQWTVDNNNGVGGECNDGRIGTFASDSDPNTANSPDAPLGGQHFSVTSKCQYDDSLFVWKDSAAAQPNHTNFMWDFWVYIPTTTKSNNVQALEFDLFQAVGLSDGVHEFMFGSQCDYGTNQWQIWLPQNGRLTWVNAGVSGCQLSSGTWHHLTYFVQRVASTGFQYIPNNFSSSSDPNGDLRFGTLTVDGNSYYLGQMSNSTIPNPKWQPTLGIQHQLDSSVSGVTIEEYSDRETLMGW